MSEEETFKVTDRRRRVDDEPAPAPPPLAPASAMPPPTPLAPTPELGAETERPDPTAGGPDLQGLFVMFASSALVALGETPDPMTGEQRVDLDQAQEAVETLLLLREKTEGNRNAAESRLLDNILYDLQMRFVQLSEEGGAELR